MYIEAKRKYLNDILTYFQKTYNLYFVEFREAPNGKKAIILCNPNNKKWWIHIGLKNQFKIEITITCTGNIKKETIINDLKNKKYIGYGKKYIGKWLPL